jgi:hypothetical protein
MHVEKFSLPEAIAQIRDQLRTAVVEGDNEDILFTPKSIELELSLTFTAETEVGGGIKLLAFLDLSTKAKTAEAGQHKLKLVLDVADRDGQPIKVRSKNIPAR